MKETKFYCPPMSYKLWYAHDGGEQTYDTEIPADILPQYCEPLRQALNGTPYFVRVDNPNIVGIAPDVEVIDGELHGILKVTTEAELTEDDIENLQDTLEGNTASWSIYFEAAEIETDGGNLMVRFYDSNEPILPETTFRNAAYVNKHQAEFEATKFYFNDSTGRVTMTYYNPDSNAGGQLVDNNMYLHSLKEAFDECKTTEQFWDHFNGCSNQYLTDINEPYFAAAAKSFVEEPCDLSEESAETMERIRYWMNEQLQASDMTAEVSAHESLRAKLHENYMEHMKEHINMPAPDIYNCAETIALTKTVYNDMMDTDYGEQSEYLLRFKNPLEVVRDQMEADQALGVGGDVAHAVWRIYDTQDMESEYELDEAYATSEQTPDMEM